MAINREQRSLEVKSFPGFPTPQPAPRKPLNAHVARAAANNLTLNVVNTTFEIREIVLAQGLQFHNADVERRLRFRGEINDLNTLPVPSSLINDFPDIVIQDDNNAVFISDTQHVEFRMRVINTKDAFKTALETPGIHVMYCGHARWGRGPCFGPDLPVDVNDPGGQDKTGDNWENGTDPVKFGLFRMGFPFVGLPFSELDDHKYKFSPVPTTVKVNPADVDKTLANPASLRPLNLRGTRFEPFIIEPVVDAYWGCSTVEGPGLLLFADFQNSKSQPFDLGDTDIQCRCFSLLGCETFDHFHSILRNRKGFKRTETEGFAYFTSDISNNALYRLHLGSLFEFPERNDFKSWFPSLEFAVKRTNQKLAARGEKYRLI